MDFFERMQSLLPGEYEQFLQAMEAPLARSLRLNTDRLDRDSFLLSCDIPLGQESPFTENAWYIEEQWGLHPLHLTGTIYLQEPSASAPVDILDVQEGDTVLDLCAAPGSKSTQILRRHPAFLLSNELDRKRAMTLLSNMERTGAVNFAVSNQDARRIGDLYPEGFDKVLVDAPCSGEGMIKKHSVALQEWSLANIQTCAARQSEILDSAVKALRPGGILVYSTCTYAPEENEEQVRAFLQRHPEMEQIPIEKPYGRSDLDQAGGLRIFPMDGGEGQFAARFRKKGNGEAGLPLEKPVKPTRIEKEFLEAQGVSWPYYCRDRDALYGMDHPFVKGNFLRQGVLIGHTVKGRFEPAHAFFMAAEPLRHVDLNTDQLDAFYHGLELPLQLDKGYVQVRWQGLPAGFGKSTGQVLKNKLPKGLRLLEGSHVKTGTRSPHSEGITGAGAVSSMTGSGTGGRA